MRWSHGIPSLYLGRSPLRWFLCLWRGKSDNFLNVSPPEQNGDNLFRSDAALIFWMCLLILALCLTCNLYLTIVLGFQIFKLTLPSVIGLVLSSLHALERRGGLWIIMFMVYLLFALKQLQWVWISCDRLDFESVEDCCLLWLLRRSVTLEPSRRLKMPEEK
jgi:hypothetical protein